MQTSEEEMDVNAAMFRQNDHCGFVLKPQYLRSLKLGPGGPVYSRQFPVCVMRIQVSSIGQGNLMKVVTFPQIISGQCLPKADTKNTDVIDPYVILEVIGPTIDNRKYKTESIHDNGEDIVLSQVIT